MSSLPNKRDGSVSSDHSHRIEMIAAAHSPRLDVETLKRACPMPALLYRLGLGAHAKKSCRSPFRDDKHPSWGIAQKNGNWFFHDFATGDSGDEFTLIARLNGLDCRRDFKAIINIYAGIAGIKLTGIASTPPRGANGNAVPQFRPGTVDQLKRLATLRGIGNEGLSWAQDRGVLLFGFWHGHEVFVLKDKTGKIVELRRLDGQLFPSGGGLQERKAHTCRGGQKSWPLGIQEARDFPCVALVEGGPDFLAAHYLALWEQASHHDRRDVRCAPVAMLSSSPRIVDDAVPLFRGKIIRIFAHTDLNGAGVAAARRWQHQLTTGGCTDVDIVDFSTIAKATTAPLKDLNDYLVMSCASDQATRRILPDTEASL